MNTDIKLSYGSLIAHFIPGFIFLLVIINTNYFANSTMTDNLISYFGKNLFFDSIIVFCVSLALGLCIDALRYIITFLPRVSSKYRKWCSFRLTPMKNDEIQIHNWIIENYFRYHQFSGNLGIIFFISGILLHGKYIVWPFFVSSLILIIAAAFMYKRAILCYKECFPR